MQEALMATLAAVGTGFAGWLFGRKKQKAETIGLDIKNVSDALLIFQKDVVDPLREELKRTRAELEDARGEIEVLRKDIEKLHEENLLLKQKYRD